MLLEKILRAGARIHLEIYLHYKEYKFKRRFWEKSLFDDIDFIQEKENEFYALRQYDSLWFKESKYLKWVYTISNRGLQAYSFLS
jgi:hypothetical protein